MISQYEELFNNTLNNYLDSIENNKIKEAYRYVLCGSGKRIRPYLLLASFEMNGLDLNKYANIALAIEIIHNYSLIHDDLPCMDNDDYRRGKLTLHRQYDETFALLVGDSMISEAFGLISSIKDNNCIKIITYLSKIIGYKGLIGGQIIDLYPSDESLNTIKSMYIHKTGDLFAFAFSCFAIIKELDSKSYEKLGHDFGIAFQLLDDINDYHSSMQEEAKLSYINKFGLDKTNDLLNKYKNEIALQLTSLGITTNTNLYNIIKETINL